MSMRIEGTAGISSLATQGLGGIEKPEGRPGKGVGGAPGQAPDVAGGASSLIQALRNFAPQLGKGDFEAKLAEITAKLREITGEVNTDRVQNELETKRKNMQENQAKIEESERKLDEAEAKKKKGNIFQRIAQAFQALGALIMIAAGAALMAIPGMQVVGAMMIAGGVLMAISLINSLVAEANDGAGILGSIAKAMGASDDVIMALDMAMTAVLMIAAVVLAVKTGGASLAAAAPAMMGKIATGIQAATKAATAITAAASGVATATQKGIEMSAASDRKEATELQARSNEIQALLQQLDDLIDQALAMLLAQSQRFNAMADALTDMMNETGDTLASTRFAG